MNQNSNRTKHFSWDNYRFLIAIPLSSGADIRSTHQAVLVLPVNVYNCQKIKSPFAIPKHKSNRQDKIQRQRKREVTHKLKNGERDNEHQWLKSERHKGNKTRFEELWRWKSNEKRYGCLRCHSVREYQPLQPHSLSLPVMVGRCEIWFMNSQKQISWFFG